MGSELRGCRRLGGATPCPSLGRGRRTRMSLGSGTRRWCRPGIRRPGDESCRDGPSGYRACARLRSLARRWVRLPMPPAPGPSEDGGLEELRESSRNCSYRSTTLASSWNRRAACAAMTSWQASSVTGWGAVGGLPTGAASTAKRVMAPTSMKNQPLATHSSGNLVFDFRSR